MQNKNFKGQNLRGRSFKNQDLTGADFSNCDLRGVDFSGANLTAAKFCHAKMGKTFKAALGVFLLQFLIGLIAGFFSMLGVIILFYYNDSLLTLFDLNSVNHKMLFVITCSLLFACFSLLFVVTKRPAYLGYFLILSLIGAGIGAGAVAGVAAIAVALAGVVAGALALALAGVVAGAVAVAENLALTLIASTIIYNTLGFYIGKRAIKKEENHLSFFRNMSLKLNSMGGTQYAFSQLHNVDFSEADLKYARFKDSIILNCDFKKAKNHHLAITTDTPLALRKVRDLIIDNKISDKDFSYLNLAGLVFSGLNLEDVDFSHSNLCGADLSHTKMTGVIIENWNIDTRTQLNEIDCAYVYLAQNQQQRNPPEGDFSINEFSKLYQQIADTIDFIAHNKDELEALMTAVNVIKEQKGGEAIFVQTIERKADSVVVKLKAPEGFDREQIYKQVKKEQKKKFKHLKSAHKQALLEKDGKIEQLNAEKQQKLEKDNDLLADLLTNAVQRPISVNNQSESNMMKKDNSRHQTFSGSNNNNVNFGDHSTLTNTLQSLPESDNNLKELLIKISALLEQSALTDDDKQDALQETATIAQAREKPAEEQQSIIAKALRSLKRFGNDLSDVPDTLAQYSTLIEEIGEVVRS